MMDVGRTINAHKQFVQPLAEKYHGRISIVSPAIINGERDPQGRIMGLKYLEQFLAGCTGCQIDYVAVHWYAFSQP
jgi:hypothetical protein